MFVWCNIYIFKYLFLCAITMMPGESHSKSAGLASGVCQNCTVLHQNLKEYVAALLILERKIIDTDHLLTEYQEKCDELQKSQRETSKLHHELDELLLKMVPLEKRNEECEAMRSQLEETNNTLKKYQQASEQTSEELDKLKEENSQLLASKNNLENQLKTYADSSIKKDCEITQLREEKKTLEESLRTTKNNLEELEIKCQKDLRNVVTQTTFPEEPKIDKAKVKLLFEELWMCIEPESCPPASHLHLSGLPCESSDHGNDHMKPGSVSVQGAEGLSEATNTKKTRKRRRTSGKLCDNTWIERTSPRKTVEKKTPPPNVNNEEDIQEILDCFKPLPPLLSPVIFTSPEKALFGDVSDSSDDEKFDDVCQAAELSPKETTDVSMVLAPADEDIPDFSAPSGILAEICENSRDKEMNASQSGILNCEQKEKSEHADDDIMPSSDEFPMEGLSGSSTGPLVKRTVSSILSTEQSIPEDTGSVKNKCSDVEDMVVVETLEEENESAEVSDNASPILQDKDADDHQVSCATPNSESTLAPQLSPVKVSSDDFGHSKDVDVLLETPTSFGGMIQGSPATCFNQSQESNETECKNPPSTLNDTTNVDATSEQTFSKATSEVNPADGPEESICFSEENRQFNADVLDLAGSFPGSLVKQTVSSTLSTEQSIPEHTGSVKSKFSDAGDTGVVETPEKEIHAEVNCEKAPPLLLDKHADDHQVSCAIPYSESSLASQLSPLGVKSDNFEHGKGVGINLKTPTGFANLIQGSLSNSFSQSQKSNETESQETPSTLHGTTDADSKSEQTVPKARSEVNPANGPEENICFSKENPQVNVNVFDLAATTLVPHCPNDEISLPKEQEADDFYSEICSRQEVDSISPSKLVITCEQPTGAITPTDWKKTLEVIQTGALSDVSNHVMEKVFSIECGKPNKMGVNACNVLTQDPTQTCQMPALSFLSSPSKTSSVYTDKSVRSIPPCSDIHPLVEADCTPAEIPAGEDKIKESTSNDPEKYKESSDEQESFELQRKVKNIYQRAGSQASSGSENDLLKPEQDSVVTQEDSRKNPGASYESQERPSEICKKSLDSSLVEQDLSTNETYVEIKEDGVPIEETFTGMLCENQVLDDIEDSLRDKSKECESNQNQSHKPSDQGCSLSLNISELKERPDSLQADDRIDESTASKITQEEAAGKPMDLNNSLSISTDTPTDDTQPGTFKNPAIPKRKRQHSDNAQECGLNENDEIIFTNLPALVTANNTTPGKSPECIRKVRFEMGTPLPPLLNPLTVTPPRFGMQEKKAVPSKLSIPSNEGTPTQKPSVAPLSSPHSDANSPCLSISSAGEAKRRRVVSSPLQFSTSTPKHAVPVPGRLPLPASNSSSSSPSAPQENSVRILDTMYPELSARARTLNILRGTVNLNRCATDTGTTAADSVGQVSRFKAVNSSRVFTKTEPSNEGETGCDPTIENRNAFKDNSSVLVGQSEKKAGANVLLPQSAKKCDVDSPVPGVPHRTLADHKEVSLGGPAGTREDGQVGNATASAENPILDALNKIATNCFDLLPVIRSHVSIKKISTVPVLRDEEKDVIHEFAVVNKHLADDLLSAILEKMKTERNTLCGMYMQALCRVYSGICRQRGDWERAHLFAYSILKEDFPDSAKLVLYIVTTWYNVLSQTGVLCRALHSALRFKAQGDVLICLTSCLDWEKKPPCDSTKIIKSTLMAMRMGVNMKFLPHDRHGDDLNHAAWTYVYALDLLCTQLQWKWTHDNIICKELWPIMNSWVTQSRARQTPISDISVATTLRLIGRLGQLGIKEKSVAPVKNVARVINTFVRHGKKEGVPWPVQLAAVYTIYDLSPCNPKEALDALAAWRGEILDAVPPAVTSCITQIGSVCRYIKS